MCFLSVVRQVRTNGKMPTLNGMVSSEDTALDTKSRPVLLEMPRHIALEEA